MGERLPSSIETPSKFRYCAGVLTSPRDYLTQPPAFLPAQPAASRGTLKVGSTKLKIKHFDPSFWKSEGYLDRKSKEVLHQACLHTQYWGRGCHTTLCTPVLSVWRVLTHHHSRKFSELTSHSGPSPSKQRQIQ